MQRKKSRNSFTPQHCSIESLGSLIRMDKKVLYAFRGWIAFVAFMDLGTSFRSYVEKRSFIGDHTDNFIQGDYVISRIVGVYSFLKALVLVHCTLYIHHKPIVSMAICALILTITLYSTEAFYFQSSTMNFYVIFPCVLNGELYYIVYCS